MSLLHMVVALVERDGSGNLATLAPMLEPHGFSREQVMKALDNAGRTGRLLKGPKPSKKGHRRGQVPSCDYYPATDTMQRMVRNLRKDLPPAKLVASVWDLAHDRTNWPSPPEIRTIHTPLGSWNSNDEVSV